MEQHYFSQQPAVPSRPRDVEIRIRGTRLVLRTDRGVFAYGHLDAGTETLLRTAPVPESGELVDLGCGYGAIALTVAAQASAARVWAVDVNARALQLAEWNARNTEIANVTVRAPDEVPEELRFTAIYSNPPVRIGREPLRALLHSWLLRLTDSGHAYLVVQRNLGSDSLAGWLTAQQFTVERLRSSKGYRVLDVHR